MCDYSLNGLRSRLAIEGEWLVTYRFPTGSIGLASPNELQAEGPGPYAGARNRSWWSTLKGCLSARQTRDVGAVCIPPGARLRMYCWPAPALRDLQIRPVMDVIFSQLSATEYQYRDAIDLRNGCTVLMQRLPEGIHFEVLSMSSGESQSVPGITETARILAEFDRENVPQRNMW